MLYWAAWEYQLNPFERVSGDRSVQEGDAILRQSRKGVRDIAVGRLVPLMTLFAVPIILVGSGDLGFYKGSCNRCVDPSASCCERHIVPVGLLDSRILPSTPAATVHDVPASWRCFLLLYPIFFRRPARITYASVAVAFILLCFEEWTLWLTIFILERALRSCALRFAAGARKKCAYSVAAIFRRFRQLSDEVDCIRALGSLNREGNYYC